MKVASITFQGLLFGSAVALAGCMSSGSSSEQGGIVDNTPVAAPAAKTFTPLKNAPAFEPDVAQVLTDGRVIVQAYSTDTWWALTPDNTGSYINGTWSQLASDPGGYAPLFYASAVIPDGRFFVGGGEYQAGSPVWQKAAAIYDPVKNTWASVTMPAAWTMMGDGQSLVLPDGRYMVADCCENHAAILNPTNLTWTTTNVGAGKGDSNYDEEGWTLMPDGKVLTVDAIDVTANVQQSEILDPSTLAWSSAGVVGVQLADNDPSRDNNQASEELGAQILRPDGTVIAFGALGPNAVYNTNTQKWSAAPSFPNGLDCADAPAALEPNGNVLVVASLGLFAETDAAFFEFDGTNLTQLTTGPSDAADNGSFEYNMLVLPTGEIMVTSQSAINVYEPTPATSTALAAIEPVITAVPVLETSAGFTDAELADIRANEAKPVPTGLDSTVDLLPLMDIYTGRTYSVAGTRLNGISLGAAYGDDAQSATDFPLVRFTNQTTQHVQYGRTHDGSNYSIALNTTGTTNVDVPTTIEKGLANMQVVANGIASPAILVNIK
ncbi:MAG TPA: hypothetical protein VGG28_03545 [Kofleriaceae bacterium]|jgi:hypothetical protein